MCRFGNLTTVASILISNEKNSTRFEFAEQGDETKQINTLKKVIKLLLNGERLPGLLMTIIRFVMPSQNHTIKKLLLIFWEIVPKTTPDGKLLQEMILVCDAYRKVCTFSLAFNHILGSESNLILLIEKIEFFACLLLIGFATPK